MAFTDRQLLDSLSRMPFIDTAELAGVLGEAHATVHRALTGLLADGIVGRANHGTAQLPSSQRYHLTAQGIREAAGILGFATPSDFVRAYPVSSEWLTLLVRRIDAVAAVYRLAASLSPGVDGLRSHVEFHRRGRFDATITLHDARSFGVVRQGLALRRRSLYDRLRAIAEYDYTRRPDTVLVLVPSVWEERLTTRFCEDRNIRDCYLAAYGDDGDDEDDLMMALARKIVSGEEEDADAETMEDVLAQARDAEAASEEYLVDDGWKPVEIEPEAVAVNGNGHHAGGIGPTVELVPANGRHANGNGHSDEAPEPQQTLFSWAEFMAEEPVKPKDRTSKPQPAAASLFEWALEMEQEREEELVGAGR